MESVRSSLSEMTYLSKNHIEETFIPKRESIGQKLLRKMGYQKGSSSSIQNILQQSLRIAKSLRLDGLTAEKTEEKGRGGFGVGVLDEEDEDIYQTEDKKDFSLSMEEKVESREYIDSSAVQFVEYKMKEEFKWYPGPIIPENYVPSTLDPENTQEWKDAISAYHPSLSIEERGRILGEDNSTFNPLLTVEETKDPEIPADFLVDSSVASLALSGFMPFENYKDKHDRYVQYLLFCSGKSLSMPTFPSNYSASQLQHEKEEFYKAAHIYRPMSFAIAQRFKSSMPQLEDSSVVHGLKKISPEEIESRKAKKEVNEKNETVAIRIERKGFIWFPSSLLCKRFQCKVPRNEHSSEYATSSKSVVKSILSDETVCKVVAETRGVEEAKILEMKLKERGEAEEQFDIGLPEERPSISLFKSIFGDEEEEEEKEPSCSTDKPMFVKPAAMKKSVVSNAASLSKAKVQLHFAEEESCFSEKKTKISRPGASDLW